MFGHRSSTRRGTPARPLAAQYPLQSWIVNLLLLAAFVLLLLGIFSPLMTINKFYIFANTVSLASGLEQLLVEGQYILFVMLGLFSIVLPLCKLGLLYRMWNGANETRAHYEKHLHWLAHYGKWSMLDVFVVAILLVTVKLGVIADVQVHFGLYAFAASVFVTMLLTARIVSLVNER